MVMAVDTGRLTWSGRLRKSRPPDPPHSPDQPHKALGHNVAKGTKRLVGQDG